MSRCSGTRYTDRPADDADARHHACASGQVVEATGVAAPQRGHDVDSRDQIGRPQQPRTQRIGVAVRHRTRHPQQPQVSALPRGELDRVTPDGSPQGRRVTSEVGDHQPDPLLAPRRRTRSSFGSTEVGPDWEHRQREVRGVGGSTRSEQPPEHIDAAQPQQSGQHTNTGQPRPDRHQVVHRSTCPRTPRRRLLPPIGAVTLRGGRHARLSTTRTTARRPLSPTHGFTDGTWSEQVKRLGNGPDHRGDEV
jgi:hypothetical protein